jgi:predicted Zn finger-like uncharacterized protein
MVLVCPQCSAHLQVDDARTPSGPFSVRCPKCQATVNHPPTTSPEPAGEALEVADTTAANDPETADSLFERPTSAPRYKGRDNHKPVAPEEPAAELNDVAKLLAVALRNSEARDTTLRKRPSWDRRKALVCASPVYRETIAEMLANNNYDVFVAENTAQGLGRMREERMDVLVLDTNFDPADQGVAFMTREVAGLRAAERRRLFLVHLTSGVRTMDPHAAFLQNVNLIVNPLDVEQLPEALDVSIRHFNDLYLPFNRVLDLTPI